MEKPIFCRSRTTRIIETINMKTVTIAIPNYNSFEAIQLCIESIRRHTNYPDYRIIVYNDRCINKIDAEYLYDCLKKGWIQELYEGDVQQTHGGSLNILINEKCQTDYAAIIDCDIVIRQDGWLEDLINEAEKHPKILAVVDYKDKGYAFDGSFRTGIYLFWFGLLNMNAYRDGMQVNWRLSIADRREEPYLSEFADLYPPERNDYWLMLFRRGSFPYTDIESCPKDKVVNDPGAQLYMKIKYNNPKGYRAVLLPSQTRHKFYHFEHISMLSIPHPSHDEKVRAARETRFAMIKTELERLRTTI